jgi:two-component system chemotaxis response regulator CheY
MSISVLVVDSSSEFGTLIQNTLEETGRYRVTLVGTGSDAIEAGIAGDFRLAIVDFDLPDLNGYDVIRQLRASRPELAVIAIPLTADPNDPKLEELKINGFLSKPFYLPDLPQIVAKTIDLPPHLEKEITSSRAKSAAVETLRTAHAPPAWLLDRNQADEYLSKLSLKKPVVAVLLTRGRKVWAQAGRLTPVQFQDLARLITDYWVTERARGSVIKYIRLANSTEDHLLQASVLLGDIILSQVYTEDAPLGKIRRRAQQFANMLMEVDPSDDVTIAEAMDKMDREMDSGASLRSPARIESGPLPPPKETNIPFPEPVDVPPPDPVVSAPAPIPTPVRLEPEVHQIPEDWVPEQPRPASHLPFLEDDVDKPAPTKPAGRAAGPTLEAKYNLPFTAILIPRFPEHSLAGNLAGRLKEWIERSCLAWDWRADEIIIHSDYLSITVSLSPEIAPSEAVRQLHRDLSAKIFETFPELENDLPSKRFWARTYLLTTGDPPQPERVRAFIKNTRQGQGLEA